MNRHRANLYAAVALFLLQSAVTGSAAAQNAAGQSTAAQRAPWVGETLDGRLCEGGDARDYGPYDYTIHKNMLWRVENRHFSTQVEQLRGGDTTAHPMGDVNYTLVRFPNHHRALYTAVRFSLGESTFGSLRQFPAECYLQRAINFSPNDSVPYMLFGLYMHRLGQLELSMEKYRAAEALAPNDANLLYNMGLVLFDSGNFEASYQYAVEAYNYGIEFPGLRRKLEEAGHWK